MNSVIYSWYLIAKLSKTFISNKKVNKLKHWLFPCFKMPVHWFMVHFHSRTTMLYAVSRRRLRRTFRGGNILQLYLDQHVSIITFIFANKSKGDVFSLNKSYLEFILLFRWLRLGYLKPISHQLSLLNLDVSFFVA